MLKKLTVMALALIIALASVCLPSFADSGADISAAVQSGDAPGESATQAEPGGAEAGPGASAGADGEEAVLYDDAETALSIMNELPATITATQAVQAGHVMRLKAEEPDLNTVVFKNGDGTRTAYQYAAPVKYVENGEIKDKSSRLVETDKGGYAYENEKFVGCSGVYFFNPSPPARGAWIEMPSTVTLSTLITVAPRTGSVD